MIQFVHKEIENFINSKIVSQTEELEALRVLSEKELVPIIHRDVENFIRLLIQMKRVNSVLEVGTAVGYSALMFAHEMPYGRITTIERSEKMYNKAIQNIETFNKQKQIRVHFGDAGEIIESLDQKYDLIFLDAAKSHYREFFEKSIKHMNNGGIIVSDNVLFKGRIVNDQYVERRNKTITRNMRNYLDFISEPPYFSSILPIGDGLSITIIKEKIDEQ